MPKSIDFAPMMAQPLPPVSRLMLGAMMTVARWELNLLTRNALKKLDDHQLRDIGLTRDQAAQEWDKPFWWG